jgi:hypothetical protein
MLSRHLNSGFFTLIIGRIFHADYFTIAKVGAVATRCVVRFTFFGGMGHDAAKALLAWSWFPFQTLILRRPRDHLLRQQAVLLNHQTLSKEICLFLETVWPCSLLCFTPFTLSCSKFEFVRNLGSICSSFSDSSVFLTLLHVGQSVSFYILLVWKDLNCRRPVEL